MPNRARFALISACILWAASFVATKIALEATPPLTVVALRLLVSAVCFLPWLVVARGSAPLGREVWLKLFGLSLLGTGLHYGAQTVGLQYTTASNASLFAVTAPITILIFSAVILGEKITALKALGICIAIFGVFTVMGWGTLMSLELGGHVFGDLLVLISIVMWGLFTVFGKKLTDQLGAFRLTAAVTVIGAVWMAPIGWIEARSTGFTVGEMSVDVWLSLGFLGVGCSFLATLLYFVALQRSESQKVGAYLYTIPPMTAVFAVLLIGEAISVNLIVGSVLVVAGVALTERG